MVELARGNVTNVQIDEKIRHTSDSQTFDYTTYLSLDNGFYGWFNDTTDIKDGDDLAVIGKRDTKDGLHGVNILAFYNLTQNVQRPNASNTLGNYLIAGFLGACGIWGLMQGGWLLLIGIALLAVGIWQTVWAYMKTRALRKLMKFVENEAGEGIISER